MSSRESWGSTVLISFAIRLGRLKYSLCLPRMIRVARSSYALARLSRTGLYKSCAFAVESNINTSAMERKHTIKSLFDPYRAVIFFTIKSSLHHPFIDLINAILTPHESIKVPHHKLFQSPRFLLNTFL